MAVTRQAGDRRAHLRPRQQPPGAHRRDRRRAARRADRRRDLESAGRRRARRAPRRPASRRWLSITARFASRDAFDRALASELLARGVSLVCLAGFMRLVGPPLLEAFPNAILNIHPSLLPAFPGVDAQRQALEHGVKVAGATVHLVTARARRRADRAAGSGAGARRRHGGDAVGADPGRGAPDLSARRRAIMLDGGWTIDGRRFRSQSTRSTRRRESADSGRASCIGVAVEIARQERVLEHHAAEDHRRIDEPDADAEPRSERQAAERHPRIMPA